MNDATFHIVTFGCQMNVNDSSWLARALERRGFTVAEAATAGVVILNTCSVREKPEQKVYQALRRLAADMRGRKAFAVVAGCVAQQIGAGFFARFPEVRLVVGSDGLAAAPDAIVRLWNEPETRLDLTAFADHFPEREAVFATETPVTGSTFAPAPGAVASAALGTALPATASPATASPATASPTASPVAYVNIMQGCDNYCAYCIVPYTRGPQKSRRPEAVLEECAALVRAGAREITLLGQNVNSYGLDGVGGEPAAGRLASLAGPDAPSAFAALVRQVAALPGLARLRFVTPHPKDFAAETIALFAELPNLCPRLHLPLQAGSDAVLEAMGRRYSRAEFLQLVEALRKARPDLALSTDLIVGFPGETEADFQETLRTMREAGFMASFSFCYSDRPGTKAAGLPDKIPVAVQKDRLTRLQALQDELSAAWLAGRVGCATQVLLESPSRRQPGGHAGGQEGVMSWQGHDPWGDTVNVSLAGGRPGLLVPVTLVTAKRHSLIGRMAPSPA